MIVTLRVDTDIVPQTTRETPTKSGGKNDMTGTVLFRFSKGGDHAQGQGVFRGDSIRLLRHRFPQAGHPGMALGEGLLKVAEKLRLCFARHARHGEIEV